ncbi:hypothetical protein HPB47_020188 [Ixodes persulcatus]|uniref:Uncharacterized protein n=1 Tax=Ixodes persulcatus TaxID=34615 RepID=A0AC60QJK7_IXOPE|nr:hypothetical protein HPB47_020188 [Ixodes persulcatus]
MEVCEDKMAVSAASPTASVSAALTVSERRRSSGPPTRCSLDCGTRETRETRAAAEVHGQGHRAPAAAAGKGSAAASRAMAAYVRPERLERFERLRGSWATRGCRQVIVGKPISQRRLTNELALCAH